MELPGTLWSEEPTEPSAWASPPPPKLENQEMDVLAFELWQRGSRQDLAAQQDRLDEDETVACHASCL
ncbi:MAG: hypothetical protein C5B51_02475 [Terriglobia bacterium]|nr:MAG: hypothetical protein C5B51_02475 [Terriglobia bacterium]